MDDNQQQARPACDLTERSIKAATPGQLLRCSVVKGLQLRATATGKSFYLYYRFQGQERRPKLGQHGQLTLTQARDAARELLKQVAMGKDPSAEKQAGRSAPTLDDLWEEFWKRYASKKKSADGMKWYYERRIKPKLGAKKLSAIQFKDVDDLLQGMADTPINANRVRALLSKMYNYGIRPLQWTADNPVKGTVRYGETKRRRYMTSEEAKAIAAKLDEAATDNPASVAFIYLLILTGARKGEIANARWEYLDGSVLRLPDSKTGFRQIFLPQIALQVLERLPRTSSTITGIASPQKLWDRIRKEVGAPDLRLHDLRHSFASAALAEGFSLSQIGELLGHASTQTTKRYAHLVEDAALKAASETANRIATMMKGQK